MKLIMTKGLPGSGKSTWAKELVNRGVTKLNPAYKRINKDELRRMLDNGVHSKENEKFIVNARNSLVEAALKKGYNVIVDDTNLAPKHEIVLRDYAEVLGAEFEIKDFTDVPIEQCIANDLKRLESVGEAVIRKMHRDFLAPQAPRMASPVPKYIEGLQDAILCDIDGTLALFGDANPFRRDFSKDQVNEPIANLVAMYSEYPRFLLSGRSDEFREVTSKWLDDNGIPYTALFMRKKGDVRKDSIIKEEIYRKEIEGKYNVLFVLDDRNQVVELWRSLGLTCLQVAPGDF
jgi:predicted kinase